MEFDRYLDLLEHDGRILARCQLGCQSESTLVAVRSVAFLITPKSRPRSPLGARRFARARALIRLHFRLMLRSTLSITRDSHSIRIVLSKHCELVRVKTQPFLFYRFGPSLYAFPSEWKH